MYVVCPIRYSALCANPFARVPVLPRRVGVFVGSGTTALQYSLVYGCFLSDSESQMERCRA